MDTPVRSNGTHAHTANGYGSSYGNGHNKGSNSGSSNSGSSSSRGTGMYHCTGCGLSSGTQLLVGSGALFP